VNEKLTIIKMRHVETAIKKVLEETQSSIKNAYHKAILSQRKDNLYSKVLLACALAETDDVGYFAPSSLRKPMLLITNNSHGAANHTKYLNDFCKDERGRILQRVGVTRRYRYRFQNPLMQSFVTMQGFADGLLQNSRLRG